MPNARRRRPIRHANGWRPSAAFGRLGSHWRRRRDCSAGSAHGSDGAVACDARPGDRPAAPPPASGARGANGSRSLIARQVVRQRPRQRVERQPKPHRRVAGNQIQPLVAQEPSPRRPGSVAAAHPPNRQRVADDRVETLREDAAQAIALQLRRRDARRTDRRSPAAAVRARGSTRRPRNRPAHGRR